MKQVDFIQEEDFETLIPLIKEFSTRTDVPFVQQIAEIASSFTNSVIFVLIGRDENNLILGYLCGYFISKSDFYVSQIYSQDRSITLKMITFMESEMRQRGASKILGLCQPDPAIFKPYGYKLERYLISKTLTKEGEK